MDVFRPELHAFALRAIIDEATDSLGHDAVCEVLQKHGVKPSDLEDSSAWVSLEFVESLLENFVERLGDSTLVDRAAVKGVSPKYLGPLYPLLFAFGSPSFTYKQLSRIASGVTKTGHWEYELSHPGAIRMLWIPNPQATQETKSFLCRFRQVQMTRIPTLFELPPAIVTHERCVLRGDAVCAYDLTWEAPAPRRHALVGLAVGLGLGLVTSMQGVTSWLMSLGICGVFALCGWALGRMLMLRQDLRRRVGDIEEHNRALDRVTRANEQRYAELFEAKAEVDEKVGLRTKELRDATQQLSETLNKLQALDRAKTDFFNNVSHELRSPLTLILAPLEELIAGRIATGTERAAYETMYRNASRLLRLINQLLDLAKIDAGQMKITAESTDLRALVRGSLHGFDAAAHKKGVQLSLEAPETMAPILLDPSWIDSAITNLLANALRLTNSGGSVRVTIEDHGLHATVAVSDDGPGIAPEEQKKVFERFAQGDSAKRVLGGTGIGLALVREATRLHGGGVELVSGLGKGSTFTLTLPRRGAVPEAATERSLPSLAPARVLVDEIQDAPTDADRAGPSPRAPLALVVEDNPELRLFIADVLAARYRVCAAGDGVQGLELARKLRPEVVVSDVAMPEMDGYELCRRLRADLETKSIPVLLVTARTDVSSVMQGFEAGASDYLLKPFHATELLARVDVHVQLRRLTGQLARQERLAALGSLAASVAHNVRNPLSALISGLPAIRARLGASVDKPTGELMGVMLDCAERIERMTIDLLDLSRIDREVSGDFAPGAGLLSCTRMFESRLTVDVVFHTDVDDKALASGRAGDMNHVFMNVIDNALRAVGTRGTIDVCGTVEDGYYLVTVADSGPGIEPGCIDSIFEPFWTTRPAGEGTGLGLSIARQIVEEHGGSISAGASPMGGAVFTVRLPLKLAERAVA